MPSAEAESGEGSSGADQIPQRPRIPHARRSNSANFSRRPSSIQQQGPHSDDEEDRPLVIKKSLKPPLLRSQSEYASPHRSPDEDIHHEEQETYWGARHGFEDHYQSEDIISQLANVS
jgi:regulator-associated protein of mTOR